MVGALSRLPVVEAWRSASRSFRALVTLIGAMAVLCVALPLCPPLQREAMRHMHLESSSLLWWSAFHLKPAMYNFENEYFLSPRPLTAENADEETPPHKPDGDHRFLNHYPLQVPLWYYRPQLGVPGRRVYVLLRSRYRGEEVITRLVIQADERGHLKIIEAP